MIIFLFSISENRKGRDLSILDMTFNYKEIKLLADIMGNKKGKRKEIQ